MTRKKAAARMVNRAARAEYTIKDTMEAGLQLTGPEVKSLREGKASLKGSFVKIREGEAWVHNLHINPYAFADAPDYEPTRTRKLLLKAKEIENLRQWDEQKGSALVPLAVYLKNNRFKLEIGIGRGKKQYERREEIKKRDQKRELRRQFKEAQLRS